MNRNKFFVIIIFGLLISNIFMIAFFFMNKHEEHSGPRKIIAERLHFDQSQITQYDRLISEHRKNIAEQEHKEIDLKMSYYALLNKSNTSKIADSLLQEIGKVSMNKEKINFNHFQDIKKICRPNQLQNFNNLINDFEKLFNHPRNKHQR
jgi:protein CpxP